MTAVLAVLSAVLYGAGDFLGGLASRRANAIAAVAASQLVGLILLGVLLPWLPGTPSMQDLPWGIAAGVAGGAGVALLYRALAVGTMAVVAPTSAVCAVLLPVLAAFASGERVQTLAVFGIGLAVVAIVLVSQEPATTDVDPRPDRGLPPGVGVALLSGVAIGFFFLALARTSQASGLWPLLVARITSVALFGLAASMMPGGLRPMRGIAGLALAGGAMDMIANAMYLVASRWGPLSVVVALVSMYPASTVVLARIVVGERLSGLQKTGVVCAIGAVALIVRAT